MINLKKSYETIIVIALLVTVLSGCHEVKLKEISSNSDGLNISMNAYFEQDYIGIGRGSNFEVKVIRLAKIASQTYNQATIEGSTKFYYYDIVIAPISEVLPLQLKNVIVSPTGKAYEYFHNKQTFTYPAPEQYEHFVSEAEFNKWDKIEDLYAYEYILVYSNLNDSIQKERKISNQELDIGMSIIDVLISYNNKTEKIRVTLDQPMDSIDSYDDPLLIVDENISKLYNDEHYSILFRTFTELKIVNK